MTVRAAQAISLSTVKVFCIIEVDYDEIPHMSSAVAVGGVRQIYEGDFRPSHGAPKNLPTDCSEYCSAGR